MGEWNLQMKGVKWGNVDKDVFEKIPKVWRGWDIHIPTLWLVSYTPLGVHNSKLGETSLEKRRRKRRKEEEEEETETKNKKQEEEDEVYENKHGWHLHSAS